jgi:uncharacterized protein with ParB-like and HNH nuclease domain
MDEQNELVLEYDFENEDDGIPSQFSGTFYTQNYPIDSLVSRLEKKDIEIPDFQREYVWKQKQASRFIESLLLNFPVPSILLTKNRETNNFLVIDGQQRLITIASFYQGNFLLLESSVRHEKHY